VKILYLLGRNDLDTCGHPRGHLWTPTSWVSTVDTHVVGVHRCPNLFFLSPYMQVLCTLSKQPKISIKRAVKESIKRAVKEFANRVQCVGWPFLCVCAGLFSQKRYVHIHMYIYIYIVYIYVYTHPFTCTRTHTFDVCAGLFSKKNPHTRECLPIIFTFSLPPLPTIYIYIYICMHTYTCIHTGLVLGYIYIYTCICMYIYTNTVALFNLYLSSYARAGI